MVTVFYEHAVNAARQTGKKLREVINIIREAGIEGFEMDFNELERRDCFFAKRLKKAGVPIVSCYRTFDWGHEVDTDDYIRVIRTLKRRGIKNLLVVPGFMNDTEDREIIMNNMLSVLRKCIDYAELMGINIYMEDFDDKVAPYSTIEGLKWFMDNEPRLSIAFDTGNFQYSEQDALDALDIFIDRTGYVHCKDRSFTPVEGEEPKETVSGRKMYSTSVGSGVIPMEEIITRLKAKGYDGVYAIEHFGSLKHLNDMTDSAKWLKRMV